MNIQNRGKFTIALLVITTFLLLTTVASVTALDCDCEDICVNETGWWRHGGDFNASTTPIQAAVDNATAGEALCVKNGNYSENVVVDVDNLTIRSQNGSANCIVTANDTYKDVFEVAANWVNITGFTVRNATGDEMAGIYLNAVEHCTISDNNATNNSCGIWLEYSSNNTLINNTANFNGDDDGIQLWGSYENNLADNEANSNGGNGISLESSDNNNLTGNEVNSNKGGFGILLDSSHHNNLTGNEVNSNEGEAGISLYESSNNSLTGNEANSNLGEGIFLEYLSHDNNLIGNTANENGDDGIVLSESDNNNLTGNRVTDNEKGIHLYTASENTITCNAVYKNTGSGFYLTEESENNTIALNGIVANGGIIESGVTVYCNLENEQDAEVNATDNYWGTTVAAEIEASIEENPGNVTYAPFLYELPPCAPSVPMLEVTKTIWNGTAWVTEVEDAHLNDTVRFNCTIKNTGNVNLTQLRFWDILDCSLMYAGNATLRVPGDETTINLEETPYHQQPYNYTFKQRVLHPNTTTSGGCTQLPGYLWDPYDPLGACYSEKGGTDPWPDFDELCPETKLHFIHAWNDTNNDGRVSACDQLWLESYEEWYHVDHVPYTLNVTNNETGESMYLDSVLDYEALNLSEPNSTAWTEICWVEACCGGDRYNLSAWNDTNNTGDLNVNDTVLLQNERTGNVIEYTVTELAKDLVVSMEWEIDHLINNSLSQPVAQRPPVGAFVPETEQDSFIVTGPIAPLNLFVLEPGQSITIEYNATVVRCGGLDNNTFRAKGNYEGNWTYSNEEVVTITVPCALPSGEATDPGGFAKEVYTLGEPVYAVGSGFAANKNVSIYIIPFQQLVGGEDLENLKLVGPVNVTTDGSGNIGPELIWPDPVPGRYLMVFDDPDGDYDPDSDPLDAFSVVSAVPLVSPLGIVALIGLLSIVALSTVKRRKKR